MKTIFLNGDELLRSQVIDVAINDVAVSIDIAKIKKSRDYIVDKVNANKIIYGVTTGFGSNADKQIKREDAEALQVNLLRSHACGVGSNFSREVVRAIMVIRLNTLLKGYSGIQESTVRQLEFFLNNKIHPIIPEQGSVGASGDLCPLSHMALPLIGEGYIEYNGRELLTSEFLKTNKIGFSKITLSYKEGLALNNGTTVMSAVGTIALYKAQRLLKVATLSSALIFESLCARKSSFAYPNIHVARNHFGQIEIAQWLAILLNGSNFIDISQKDILTHVVRSGLISDSEIQAILNDLINQESDSQIQVPMSVIYKLKVLKQEDIADIIAFANKKWKPQDSYSIRCLPQVFGASKAAIDHVVSVIDNELNAAVDNPLIFVDDDMVISGGNFHGQPIALVMDYLKLAVAEIGNIVERQINKLVDSNTNDCLPSFLINDTGLNSGLMIPQYVAAAIVSENKVLVHPASADSIPTCENTEDHVSMGTIAARQSIQIIENVEKIISIAILTGFYAVSIRLSQFGKVGMKNTPQDMLSPAMFEFYDTIRSVNKEFQNTDFFRKDRFLSPEIKILMENFNLFSSIGFKYLD